MSVFVLLLILLGLFGAYSALVHCFGMKGVSYRRYFSKETAVIGETLDFVEVIRNKSPFLLPWVRLETKIPSSFVFTTREEVNVRSSNYLKSAFTLMPFCQVTRRHKVKVTHRGHFMLENAALTYGDFIGTSSDSRDLYAPAEIFVYPMLLSEDELTIPSSRWQGDIAVRRWIQPDPFLMSGIRPYQLGDTEKDIHWAATARTGALQVKVRDYTANPKLMVILNVQKTEEQWDNISEAEYPVIEEEISLAASLCVYALSHGISAGFASNMPVDKENECTWIAPVLGTGAEDSMMKMFASLRIRKLISFSTFLSEMPADSGMDVLIISCYDSENIQENMAKIRLMGNSVTLLVHEI